MKKKVLIFIAAICVLLGGAMLAAGLKMGGTGVGFNINKELKVVAEPTEYRVADFDYAAFSGIDIDVSEATVEIVRSEDGKYGVDLMLYSYSDKDVQCEVVDDTLVIKRSDRFFSINVDFSFFTSEDEYIRLYLPEAVYDGVSIDTSNAARSIKDLDAGSGNITAVTSNAPVSFTNANGQKILADTSNSGVTLEKVNADELKVDTSNGRVELANVESEILNVESSNGAISFTDVSGAEAVLDTSNSKVTLLRVRFDRKLNVENSNGAIEVTLLGSREDYAYDIDTSNANITIDGDTCEDEYRGGKGDARVKLDTSNAAVRVEFEK